MSTPWTLLESAVCFVVSGKDAKRYLHNRLSNDIRGLAVGASLEAAALSAQGRVEGFFSVQCLADDRFVLVADGGESEALRATLGKFIVADRVTLENVTSSVAVLHIAQEQAELGAHNVYSPDQCVGVISCRRVADTGAHVVLKREALDEVTKRCRALFGEPVAPREYETLRWKAGVPVYPTELNDDVILTECGMREAVSFTKGCYVGQEVLERSDAIGKLPRTLERLVLTGDGVVASGASLVSNDGAPVGKVVSSVANNERAETLVFALLRTGKYSRGDVVRCGDRLATIV